MHGHHLADLNAGRLMASTDDPRVAEFVNAPGRANGESNFAFGSKHLTEVRLWQTRACKHVAAE